MLSYKAEFYKHGELSLQVTETEILNFGTRLNLIEPTVFRSFGSIWKTHLRQEFHDGILMAGIPMTESEIESEYKFNDSLSSLWIENKNL